MAKELPLEEIKALVGREVYVSGWKEVSQGQIDGFADATGDHQWIHVDPVKAAQGPFGRTIAHGFLTLSHIPFFSYQGAVSPEGAKVTINYGLNKVRFPNPVPCGFEDTGPNHSIERRGTAEREDSDNDDSYHRDRGEGEACLRCRIPRAFFHELMTNS